VEDRHAPALSRLALQALLHPTVFPDESRGPTSCEGHPGFRSAGHEATEQLAEGMIAIGMLNPSRRDTTFVWQHVATQFCTVHSLSVSNPSVL
jgi:hypothetical protein